MANIILNQNVPTTNSWPEYVDKHLKWKLQIFNICLESWKFSISYRSWAVTKNVIYKRYLSLPATRRNSNKE